MINVGIGTSEDYNVKLIFNVSAMIINPFIGNIHHSLETKIFYSKLKPDLLFLSTFHK